MRNLAGIVVVVVGIILIVWGANASQSVSSDFSRIFTGSVTNKAIYLIVGGAVALVAGASMTWSSRRKRA